MKSKIMLLLLGVYSCSSALAQTDSLKSNKQNNKYKWGVGVAINSVEAQLKNEQEAMLSSNFYFDNKTDKSFSFSIIPRFFYSNNLLIRMEIGLSNIHIEENSNTKSNQPAASDYFIRDALITQKIYNFMPGLQYYFFNAKPIKVFLGIKASYINYGEVSYTSNDETRSVVSDTLVSSLFIDAKYPKGFAIGLGVVAGVDVLICKRVSLGAECSFSLLDYKIGGDLTGTLTSQHANGQPKTEAIKEIGISYNGIAFSKIIPSLNITLFF